jgi:glutamate dehydrogenase/leucine dehydrogenase
MRKGLNKEEVVSLAKVMEIKFSVAGPPIGGAKSGIDFDPRDPRREEVLQRWYKAVFPLLKNYYGTGGDLNIDELRDVIPVTEPLGLWHPQEGIVNGHLKASEGQRVAVLGQLRTGVSKVVEDSRYTVEGQHLAVADLITGYGVSEAVAHYYRLWQGQDLRGKRVLVQGWGNVASAAAWYLAKQGARIVGILDIAGGLLPGGDGLGLEEVEDLFLAKDGNRLRAEGTLSFEEANQRFWDVPADIFIPGAASKLISREQIDRLMQAGLHCMSCGANVPFVDDLVFFGPTARYSDSKIAIIPDFIANCGMARVFAYLMQPNAPMTDEAIFSDVSQTIGDALALTHANNKQPFGISTASLQLALEKLLG